MLRGILIFFCILIIYNALKTVFRSARQAYHREDPRTRIMGDEMVQDPECHTYVLKDRAVVRRIRGANTYFCSDDCARQYEEKNRKLPPG
jgi:YHS domain-containing protein